MYPIEKIVFLMAAAVVVTARNGSAAAPLDSSSQVKPVLAPHWAFVAPERPRLPRVQQVQWPRNPIDYFILARLEKEMILPSSEADRITLARRVFLDLTGLPPTIEQVDEFLKDRKPDAYERLV